MTRFVKRIVVHHSASPLTTTFDDIRRWHVEGNKFNSIGYHYVIESDGGTFKGRPDWKQGAHCSADKANHDSIGICVVGNNTTKTDRWTEESIKSLVLLIQSLYDLYGKQLPIYGHRDIPGAKTLCPGLDVITVLRNAEKGIYASS